jgi:transcriptional adapter 2-alpha
MRKPQSKLPESPFWESTKLTLSALPPPTGPLVSAPTNHEVAGFMPGRLEFEHEVENEAEMAVKDLEFGLVWRYGGDEQPESVPVPVPDEDPAEEEEEADGADGDGAKGEKKGGSEKEAKGDGEEKVVVKVEKGSGDVKEEAIDVDAEADVKPDISRMEGFAPAAGEAPGVNGHNEEEPNGKAASPSKVDKGKEKAKEEPLFEVEDEDELDVKLALLEIYFSKLDKREEAKEIIFDRGLTEHKRVS